MNNTIILFPNGQGGITVCRPIWKSRQTFEVSPRTITEVTPPTIFTNEQGEREVIPGVYQENPAVYREETDEEVLARVIKVSVPSGSPYLLATTDDIPADRSLREAWTADFTGAPINR